MLTLLRALLLISATVSVVTGCVTRDEQGRPDDVGVIQMKVTAPAGVGCIRTRFAGSREVTRDLPVSGSVIARLDGLPTGTVDITSAAFAGACGAAEPLWLSEPLTVTLTAGQAVAVSLVFRPNGIALVTGTFVSDDQDAFPVGVHTDPADPALATLKHEDLTVVAYGTRDGSGGPASLQTLKAQRPGQADVFVPLDAQGRMTGFVSDQISASFRHTANGRLSVHVEGPGFAGDVEVQDPWTQPPSAAAPAIVMSPSNPGAAGARNAAAGGARVSALTSTGAEQSVSVGVDRCGAPENNAVVTISTVGVDGVMRTEVANRVGEGTYERLVSLPPADPAGSHVDFDKMCEGIDLLAHLTCDALEVQPGAALIVCPAILALSGGTAIVVEPICLAAFAAVKWWCHLTSVPGTPIGQPGVAGFVCELIDEGLSKLQPANSYPIAISAAARVPGLSTLFRSGRVSIGAPDVVIPPLSIEVDSGCGNQGGAAGQVEAGELEEAEESKEAGGAKAAVPEA